MELIDHCCCHIENMLDDRILFEDALNRSVSLVAPDGLPDLEAELNRPLTQLIPKTMKTSLYFFGFLAAFGILVGTMMGMQQWPGANMVLLIGDGSLIVAMLTLLITIIRFPSAFVQSTLVRTSAGASGGLILGAGGFIKIMQWPGASFMFVIGMTIIAFVFLPLFFWQLYKREIAQ